MISIHLMETDRGAVGGHIGKGLYYGSYRSPRVILWSIGVVIFLVMMGFNSYFFNESYFIYFTLSPIALSTLKLGNITPQLIMDDVRNTRETGKARFTSLCEREI